MKVLHTADVHLEKATHGKMVGGRSSRLTDFAATFDRFAHAAVDHEVDLAIVAGDLFDNRRPGPEAIHAAVKPLAMLSAMKIRTVIVPGNHDGMGTIADPTSHTLTWMAALDMPFVHVLTEPRTTQLGTKAGGVSVVSVPFPHRRAYDVTLEGTPAAERIERVGADVQTVVEYLCTEAAKGADPVVFVGHLTVAGGASGPRTTMRTGWDVMISPDALAAADYAALGHLHPLQQVAPNAWYSGSPDFQGFDEVGQEKGFLLVDVVRGQPPNVEVIDSGSRPMLVVEVAEVDGWQMQPLGRPDVGATVLLRLKPTDSPKAPASVLQDCRRRLYAAGAFLVKDETIVPEQQRRARVEIDPEVDVKQATLRWCQAKGVDPDRLMPVAEELFSSFRAES